MMSYYLRNQVIKFVILFVERSGSTYLASMLATHPQIHAKREEFAQLRQRSVDGGGQLVWARDFWTPSIVGPYKAIGFKTKLVDILDLAGFKDLLQKNRVHVIQLQRKNLVKAVISTINAKRLHDASGNWNLLNEADRLSSFSVDTEEFDCLLQERINWDTELVEFAASLNLPNLQLYYEDLLRNERSFLEQVFEFIQVKPKPLQGKTKKNTKDDLREVVDNLDDLRSKYKGTRFESMFDEVLA